MRWVHWWIIVVLAVVSSCGVNAPPGSVCQERGNGATFAFRDFRLGMTRAELYEVLNGMELTWTGEMWKLPEESYPGLDGVGVLFDDVFGLTPRSVKRNETITVSAQQFEPYQLDARLVIITVELGESKEKPLPILDACKKRYGRNPKKETEQFRHRHGILAHITLFTWNNERHDTRATLQILPDFDPHSITQDGVEVPASSFRSTLKLVFKPCALETANEIMKEETRRLGARETQQQADLISGRETELPDRLPIERNPVDPEPLLGRWILRVQRKKDSSEEMVGFFRLSRKDGERTVVGSFVGIQESDISHDQESIHGGLYKQDDASFVILRSATTEMMHVGILTGERIWGGGWYAYRAPPVSDKMDVPDFSGTLVVQRAAYPGFPRESMGASSGINDQYYLNLKPLDVGEIGSTYPYQLYIGGMQHKSIGSRIVSQEPEKAFGIYKDGILSVRGGNRKIIFTRITEDPILKLLGDPKGSVFRDIFRGRRLKDIPELPPIQVSQIVLRIDGKSPTRDQIRNMYPSATAAFGMMYAVADGGGYQLLSLDKKEAQWTLRRVGTLTGLGYIQKHPLRDFSSTEPIFTAKGVSMKERRDMYAIYPPETIAMIRAAGLQKAGHPFTVRHIFAVDPQIEYDTRTRKMQLTARNVRTTHYYRW